MQRLALAVLLAVALASTPAQAQSAAQPWIGIAIATGTRGVLVNEVIEATPAARAGLLAKDEVLAIDGAAVKEPGELIGRVRAKGVGEKVALHLARAGKELDVTLALEARPDEVQQLRDRLIGKPAPAFTLADSRGTYPAKLAALSGNVVVIEFWATWCGPCNTTLPRLTAWQAKYGSRGLRVVGVSTEGLELISRHAAERKVGYTIAHDEGAMHEAYRVPAIPTLVVIDQQGVVRFADVGAGEKLDAAEKIVVGLLDARAH